MKTNLLLSLAIILMVLNSYAQNNRTCGTMQNLQDMIAKDPSINISMQQLENFTAQWVKNHSLQKTQKNATVITIPVVVHVIHNNEAIGVGQNISDNQIASQIIALNEDFRLHNDDSLLPTHPFWPYTADTQIEFCLAQRTPSNTATNGIERIYGGQANWTRADIESIVKPQTIWNRNQYLNLWVLTFGGADAGLLGYAQFPGTGSANTDGVVIRYNSFGYVGTLDPPYDNGRTGVHEVGHWLNLRHIWGDNQPNCGDDLVSDTKPAPAPNFNCPSFPFHPSNACGTDANGEMYMNYMDYVDDACMVMFTFGQANRMQAALSGARSSLLSSQGCVAPVGIEELSILHGIDIYPNPNDGSFNIYSSNLKAENTRIELINILGATIQSFENIKLFPYQIKTHDLAEGVYYVKITNGNYSVTKKILITR